MLAMLLCYAALCDPHFDRREAAESRLVSLLDRHPATYGPRLAEWCRAATCPEVRSRSLRALRVYDRWRVATYVPATCPVWPICDAFPVACLVIPFGLEDVRDRHRWPVESIAAASGGPNWTAYRVTTERRIRAAIRDGAAWEECDRLLERMWSLERRSKHDCGVRIDPAGWSGGYLRP